MIKDKQFLRMIPLKGEVSEKTQKAAVHKMEVSPVKLDKKENKDSVTKMLMKREVIAKLRMLK